LLKICYELKEKSPKHFFKICTSWIARQIEIHPDFQIYNPWLHRSWPLH